MGSNSSLTVIRHGFQLLSGLFQTWVLTVLRMLKEKDITILRMFSDMGSNSSLTVIRHGFQQLLDHYQTLIPTVFRPLSDMVSVILNHFV